MIDFDRDPTTHDRLFIHMSANYLTERLPDEAIDWDEDQIEEFIERHAWEPLEYLSADCVVDMIASAVFASTQFFRHEVLKLTCNDNEKEELE
tara:strand:+ start:234 stop:512 length:279 start_codon:yes stop_codon:yes gene_type:complete